MPGGQFGRTTLVLGFVLLFAIGCVRLPPALTPSALSPEQQAGEHRITAPDGGVYTVKVFHHNGTLKYNRYEISDDTGRPIPPFADRIYGSLQVNETQVGFYGTGTRLDSLSLRIGNFDEGARLLPLAPLPMEPTPVYQAVERYVLDHQEPGRPISAHFGLLFLARVGQLRDTVLATYDFSGIRPAFPKWALVSRGGRIVPATPESVVAAQNSEDQPRQTRDQRATIAESCVAAACGGVGMPIQSAKDIRGYVEGSLPPDVLAQITPRRAQIDADGNEIWHLIRYNGFTGRVTDCQVTFRPDHLLKSIHAVLVAEKVGDFRPDE